MANEDVGEMKRARASPLLCLPPLGDQVTDLSPYHYNCCCYYCHSTVIINPSHHHFNCSLLHIIPEPNPNLTLTPSYHRAGTGPAVVVAGPGHLRPRPRPVLPDRHRAPICPVLPDRHRASLRPRPLPNPDGDVAGEIQESGLPSSVRANVSAQGLPGRRPAWVASN